MRHESADANIEASNTLIKKMKTMLDATSKNRFQVKHEIYIVRDFHQIRRLPISLT